MAKLKFYYGVMGAGKTTELLKTYDIYSRKGLNPLIIKPNIDDREGAFKGWGFTSSRLIPEKTKAYYFSDLKTELPSLNYGTLFVDEAQFMTKEDILFLSTIIHTQNIDVLAYGLKTDVNGNLFPGAAALLAIADETRELETLCEMDNCQNKAVAHLRYIDGKLDNSNEAIAIEKNKVTYKSVCNYHWLLAKGKLSR